MSTTSLASPAWSAPAAVINSASFDPHTSADPPFSDTSPGVDAPNYPSIVDPDSPGRSYEYTDGQFYMYYATKWQHIANPSDVRDRNLYRVSITVSPN